MENKLKTSSFKFVNNMLDKPHNPTSAVLRELLAFYNKGTSRRWLEQATDILNVPDVIMNLRRKGIEISTTMVKSKNKFGRPVSYGIYHLLDFKIAVEYYKKINKPYN